MTAKELGKQSIYPSHSGTPGFTKLEEIAARFYAARITGLSSSLICTATQEQTNWMRLDAVKEAFDDADAFLRAAAKTEWGGIDRENAEDAETEPDEL